jgi:hypothetical protein
MVTPHNDEPNESATLGELGDLETALSASAKSKAMSKAVTPCKAKSVPAKPSVIKAKPAVAAKALPKATGPKTSIPHWGPKRSRGQVMCRTGLAGAGQSHAIKIEVAGSKAAAIKLADQWVLKKKKELKIK